MSSFITRLETSIDLSQYSTFKIGGPASYFFKAMHEDDLREAFRFANEESIPYMVLGKGSNCLFSDKGYKGLVILNKIEDFSESDGSFWVGSGVSFARLGVETAKEGWSGLEFASGIPGTVGGAIFMNAGAHGASVSSTLQSVKFLHEDGTCSSFRKDELEFDYRFSSFQKMKGAIVQATFLLKKDLHASDRQKEYLFLRMKTQPYKDRSIGCFFKNPEGYSAGRLIEEVGLKGFSINDASVSEIHANFIVNRGSCRAEDVLRLMSLVQEKVHNEKGILLHPEVRVIPYE